MKPEDTEEEGAERVEHLDEEVPPEAGIGGQVRQGELDTIGASEELPRVTSEHKGHAEQYRNAPCHYKDIGTRELKGGSHPALLGLAIIGQEDNRRKKEDWVHREVGGERHGDHSLEGRAVDGFGNSEEDRAGCEYASRAAYACRNGIRVKQEPVSVSAIIGRVGNWWASLRCSNCNSRPLLSPARRDEQLRAAGLAGVCNVGQRIGAQDIDRDVEEVGEDRPGLHVREEREQGE